MTQTKRRIMRDFTIDEISGVDRPAQGHARMTIMKREGEEEEMTTNVTDGAEPAAFPTFEAAVAHLRRVNNVDGTQAMRLAARQHPGLLKAYNEEGQEQIEKAAEAAKAQPKPKAVERFELLTDAIMDRDGVKRSVAMRRARRENPKAFRAFQLA